MQSNSPVPNNHTFPLSSWATEMITVIFSAIDPHAQDFCLLTGSTLHTILSHETPKSLDIDLVTTASSRLLTHQGFTQNINNPQLYTKPIILNGSACYLEVFRVVSYKRSLEEFVEEDQKRRDFTICRLYAYYNKNNNTVYILDPTHQGIHHLLEKILHIPDDPLQSFNEDPMRLLRAIKYILREYTPSLELYTALQAWKRPETLSGEMLIRMNKAIKKIFHNDVEKFNKLSEKYVFLKKLFQTHDNYLSVISNEERQKTSKLSEEACKTKDNASGSSASTITAHEEMSRSRSCSISSSISTSSNSSLKTSSDAETILLYQTASKKILSPNNHQPKSKRKKKKGKRRKKTPIAIAAPTEAKSIAEKPPLPAPKSIDRQELIVLIEAFIALHSKGLEKEKYPPKSPINCIVLQEKQLYNNIKQSDYLISYFYTVLGLLGVVHCSRQAIKNTYTITTLFIAAASCLFVQKGVKRQMLSILDKHGFFDHSNTSASAKIATPKIGS